jgi:hypothetical protein
MLLYGTTQAEVRRSHRMVARTRVIKTAESERDASLAVEVTNRGNPKELDDCIATSERLLHVLIAEAEALKTFQKDRLLQVITEKEALANELANRMKSFESSESFNEKIGQQVSPLPGSTGINGEERDEAHAKRGLLSELLGEIVEWNQRNRIFIQGSLGHWQELINLCLPSTYLPVQDGQTARQSIGTKGLALNREI